MEIEKKLKNLALNLFDINAVKFGEFMTKSGMNTPIYFDLRVIVSYPNIMELIASLLHEFALKDITYDHVCGVPYTALPIATLLSVKTKIPMLMRRKEAKGYGTKKMIEGHYRPGQTCLIIEDVVTTGSSVLETVNDLRKEGLTSSEAIVILDREQGGHGNLKENGVQMKSLFTMTKLLEILEKNNKISEEIAENVRNYFKGSQAATPVKEPERIYLPFEKRAELATNSIAKRLFRIMSTKKTNLCLSVDLTSSKHILDLVQKVGTHVCLVKTHIDIIEDFNSDFISQLKQLAQQLDFLILEDRKYADIGNTVYLQYMKGLYKVGEWADCITVHSIPGDGILKALYKNMGDTARGVFLLAEMSSEGNLITQSYKEATVKMANSYPELITGFVCQNKETFNNAGHIQLTPGVQLENSSDGLGQVYNTPEKIMLKKGADIAVVGRGIVSAENPEKQAVVYKETLWKYYNKRVWGKGE